MATLPDPLEIIDTPELRQDCISNIKLKLYDSLFKLKYYHFIFELVESHNYVCVKLEYFENQHKYLKVVRL